MRFWVETVQAHEDASLAAKKPPVYESHQKQACPRRASEVDDDIPYLLLTPGPLTTSRGVREAMLRDYCTWDDDYNSIVTDIRRRLVQLAAPERPEKFTAVLMQGSGTFCVEATLGSVVPPRGKVLVVNNGAYGARLREICRQLRIEHVERKWTEVESADPESVDQLLAGDSAITHVAVVHCETTTGMLNPVERIGDAVKRRGRKLIVDAMSSLGGIPLTMDSLGADFLVSSANKCIQGVPGFGLVIANRELLGETAGWARSLSLDLHGQWLEMETKGGKWRYTSPTHVVRAFAQALDELDAEGGVTARNLRYAANHAALVTGLRGIGFKTLLPDALQSPIITSFVFPDDPRFNFQDLYDGLKSRRFVIYPGKVSQAETFRVGNIGHVFPPDMVELTRCFSEVVTEHGWRLRETPQAAISA